MTRAICQFPDGCVAGATIGSTNEATIFVSIKIPFVRRIPAAILSHQPAAGHCAEVRGSRLASALFSILFGGTVALATPAFAHDQWADGSAIPAWVKSSCCGAADAHLLTSDDVSLQDDGWHIRGINTVVPRDRVLPSQDGQIWGFWNPEVGPNPPIYCFFAPMEF